LEQLAVAQTNMDALEQKLAKVMDYLAHAMPKNTLYPLAWELQLHVQRSIRSHRVPSSKAAFGMLTITAQEQLQTVHLFLQAA
jgi:hypothetical protein